MVKIMSTHTIDELRSIVSNIAMQYGVKKVALFGSYSVGNQTADSDIDLLIDKGEIKGFFMMNRFINSLQDKLNKDVDVITYSSLERSLIKDSVKNEVILYEQQRCNYIKKIIQYANEIELTINRFELNYELFVEDFVVRNAVSMCILQIGELVGKLSEEFKNNYNGMPWREIKAMRNIAAHNYGEIDIEVLWETITGDIPDLKGFCKDVINKN